MDNIPPEPITFGGPDFMAKQAAIYTHCWFIYFLNLSKVFDIVTFKGLWKVLPLIGCPSKIRDTIRQFHNGMLTKGVGSE